MLWTALVVIQHRWVFRLLLRTQEFLYCLEHAALVALPPLWRPHSSSSQAFSAQP